MKKTRVIFILLFISLFCLTLGTACKKKNIELAPEIASSDEALFKHGERFLKKDPERARLYLRQVIDSFPKSFYAQRAKLSIADSYFNQGDVGSMLLAASEYREFISLYPYSPYAAYAQFQIAMTHFTKILKPGRDQSKTELALAAFQKTVTNYPNSDVAKAAQEKIKECEERLALHIFLIGEHYYKVGSYAASIRRLVSIMTKYPDFSKMDRVYYLLGDTYLKSNLVEQSVPYFTKLITDFPQSKYAKKAQKKMAGIEKIQKKQEDKE